MKVRREGAVETFSPLQLPPLHFLEWRSVTSTFKDDVNLERTVGMNIHLEEKEVKLKASKDSPTRAPIASNLLALSVHPQLQELVSEINLLLLDLRIRIDQPSVHPVPLGPIQVQLVRVLLVRRVVERLVAQQEGEEVLLDLWEVEIAQTPLVDQLQTTRTQHLELLEHRLEDLLLELLLLQLSEPQLLHQLSVGLQLRIRIQHSAHQRAIDLQASEHLQLSVAALLHQLLETHLPLVKPLNNLNKLVLQVQTKFMK